MKKLLLALTTILVLANSKQLIGQVAPYVPSSGLVGWWSFTGNANDSSGNGNNGTVNGATLTADRFGNTNSAYAFNGTSDFITVQNSASLSLVDSASFSFWMIWDGDNNNGGNSQTIIDKSSSSNIENYRIAVEEPSAAVPNKLATLSNGAEVHSNSTYSTGTWVHTVVTIDAGTVNIYINGVLDFTGALNLAAVNTDDLFFGQSSQSSQHFFKGTLDDIGIWNRALSQVEITSLNNANVPIIDCPVLVDSFTMAFTQPFSYISTATVNGDQYYLKVSGTYGVANNVNHVDAAFNLPPNDSIPEMYWNWDGLSTQRPTPDIYDSSHVYYYYFIGNGTTQTFTFTDNPYSDNSGSLYFELYHDTCTITGITSSPNENADAIIFPNPFSYQATLWNAKPLSDATLTIVDCLGETVQQVNNISGQTIIINRDNLQAGIYFVHITQGSQEIVTNKIIITN